ncbi:MAG: galactose oxidase-like domain-containing protein [Thermoplasmatota archaeon]
MQRIRSSALSILILVLLAAPFLSAALTATPAGAAAAGVPAYCTTSSGSIVIMHGLSASDVGALSAVVTAESAHAQNAFSHVPIPTVAPCPGDLAPMGAFASTGGNAPIAPAAFEVPPTNGSSPTVSGLWEQPFDGLVPAVNMALLPDGRVLYYSGVEANESDQNPADQTFFTTTPLLGSSAVWDPATGATTVYPSSASGAHDLFCTGITILPNGEVLAAGGTQWETLPNTATPVQGTNDTRLFNGTSWSFGPNMLERRWYPSVIELADGRALVASGIKNLTDPSTMDSIVEVYDGTHWTAITHPLAQHGDVEVQPMNLPMYPRLFVVPGGPLKGQVFYSTTGTLWGPFGERPEEAIWSLQQALDTSTGTWTTLGPSVLGARQHGAVVPLMLNPSNGYAPQLLTFGGTLERSVIATPTAEIADLSTNPPTNHLIAPMADPRWHVNGVLLPNGNVLAVGGGLYDDVVVHGAQDAYVMNAEQYNPSAGNWTTLAPMTVPRAYHSTAILLPDGRVLVGGNVPLPNPSPQVRGTVNPQIAETRLQIFDPPYLFLDSPNHRPVIDPTSVPPHVAYGQHVEIRVNNLVNLGRSLQSMVLVKPGATTHAFNADQRGIDVVAHLNGNGTVDLTMPPDGTVAPPGTYMLFANANVQGQAFPSVAAFVHIG